MTIPNRPAMTLEQVRNLHALAVAEQRAQEAAHAALCARMDYQRGIGLSPWHAATWEPAQGAIAATALGAALRALGGVGHVWRVTRDGGAHWTCTAYPAAACTACREA